MKKYEQWLLDAAEFIKDEHSSNNIHDLNCAEIAKGLKGGKAVSPAEVEGYRCKLRVIIKILRSIHGIELVLTTDNNWYLPLAQLKKHGLQRDATFRERPPGNDEECRFCAPIGAGRKRWGLYIAHTKNDLYWQYMNRFHHKTSAMSNNNASRRTILGKKGGHISLRAARKQIQESITGIRPENLSELGKLGNGENNEPA